MNIPSKEEIYQMIADANKELIKEFKASQPKSPAIEDEWLDIKGTCKALRISTRLLQQWRTEGKWLGHAMIGNRILYRKADIIKLLEDNFNTPFKKHK